MSTSKSITTCPIQSRRRQAIIDRIAIHHAQQKRNQLFAMKIPKRKRDVNEDTYNSSTHAPSKRIRGEHSEKENRTPLDLPHLPRPVSNSFESNATPSRSTPGVTMKDILAIINPSYVLPPTFPSSGVPKDASAKHVYGQNLDHYCRDLQRTQKFWDEAELAAELKVLRQVTGLINMDTIPGLPERISKTLAEVESGMLEEASWPTWRRKMAMLILSIINLNKGRCGDQD